MNIRTILSLVLILAVGGVLWYLYPKQDATPQTPEGEIGASQTYDDADFSIHYPEGYAADTHYAYQGMGPGMDIAGVKFTIPASMSTGTNLSSDSYVSVEKVAADTCSAQAFLNGDVIPNIVTENGIRYSVASLSDAAAGNRYEETVYAVVDSNPCIAVRYFIHYGAIGNYPEGQVKEFDKDALTKEFDSIRATLVVKQ